MVRAPFAVAFPLFGAHGERAWAGAEWNPRFLHPLPERDEPGEVFLLSHGHREAVWVNTAMDSATGRIQYVHVFPGVQTATIDLHVTARDSAHTRVAVVYRRTALDPQFNAHVEAAAKRDQRAGPEWAAAIEVALSKR